MMWDLNAAADFVAPRRHASEASKNHKTPEALQEELGQGRLFCLSCELSSHQPVGDHVLVVGKVVGVLPASPEEGQIAEGKQRKALLWCLGGWHEAVPLPLEEDDDSSTTSGDSNIGRRTEAG